MNEKSNIQEPDREGVSSAESNPKGSVYEVHSGVDPVKWVVAGYVWHTLRVLSEGCRSFIRVEPRIELRL